MAQKRMFTKKIVDSDAFLEMPLTTQCLYFHLNMQADDDGFVGNPKKIMRIIGAKEEDFLMLLEKRFLLKFEDSVIVIKHWRMHNTLSQNRYHETQYLDEKSMLKLKDNGSYTFGEGKTIDDEKMKESAKRQTVDRRDKDGQETESDKELGLEEDIEIGLGKPAPEFAAKNSNAKNVKVLLVDAASYGYITSNVSLFEIVTDWMSYKDQKTPKSNNRYTEIGMSRLLNKFISMDKQYGTAEVIRIVNEAMENNYQGIVWDRLQKGGVGNGSGWKQTGRADGANTKGTYKTGIEVL